MSETTIHERLVTVLEGSGLFNDGSIVVNDQPAIARQSRDRAPYVIIETADAFTVIAPAADPMASITYRPVIRLVDFAGGRGEKAGLDAFRTLRDGVIAALVANMGGLTAIAPDGRISPFLTPQDGQEADSLTQGLICEITEYI